MVAQSVTLRQMVAGIIIFGTLLTGMLNFTGAMFNSYDVTYENDTLSGVATEATENSTAVARNARNAASDVGQGGIIATGGFFLRSVWQVISTTGTVIIAVPSIVSSLAAEVPGQITWLVTLITGVVFVWFAYEIVSLYRGVRT